MTSSKAPRLFIALYTDEDVTSHLVPALRRRGYTAQSAAAAHKLGATDEAQRYAEKDYFILSAHLCVYPA